MFSSSLFIVIACTARLEGMKMLGIFAYYTVVHFTDQTWISKTMCRIPYSMIVWGVWWSVKLVLQIGLQQSHFAVRPWSLLTILNFFRTGADRHNGILMSLLLLVAETKMKNVVLWFSAEITMAKTMLSC